MRMRRSPWDHHHTLFVAGNQREVMVLQEESRSSLREKMVITEAEMAGKERIG